MANKNIGLGSQSILNDDKIGSSISDINYTFKNLQTNANGERQNITQPGDGLVVQNGKLNLKFDDNFFQIKNNTLALSDNYQMTLSNISKAILDSYKNVGVKAGSRYATRSTIKPSEFAAAIKDIYCQRSHGGGTIIIDPVIDNPVIDDPVIDDPTDSTKRHLKTICFNKTDSTYQYWVLFTGKQGQNFLNEKYIRSIKYDDNDAITAQCQTSTLSDSVNNPMSLDTSSLSREERHTIILKFTGVNDATDTSTAQIDIPIRTQSSTAVILSNPFVNYKEQTVTFACTFMQEDGGQDINFVGTGTTNKTVLKTEQDITSITFNLNGNVTAGSTYTITPGNGSFKYNPTESKSIKLSFRDIHVATYTGGPLAKNATSTKFGKTSETLELITGSKLQIDSGTNGSASLSSTAYSAGDNNDRTVSINGSDTTKLLSFSTSCVKTMDSLTYGLHCEISGGVEVSYSNGAVTLTCLNLKATHSGTVSTRDSYNGLIPVSGQITLNMTYLKDDDNDKCSISSLSISNGGAAEITGSDDTPSPFTIDNFIIGTVNKGGSSSVINWKQPVYTGFCTQCAVSEVQIFTGNSAVSSKGNSIDPANITNYDDNDLSNGQRWIGAAKLELSGITIPTPTATIKNGELIISSTKTNITRSTYSDKYLNQLVITATLSFK